MARRSKAASTQDAPSSGASAAAAEAPPAQDGAGATPVEVVAPEREDAAPVAALSPERMREIERAMEAIALTLDKPVSAQALAEGLSCTPADVRAAAARLNEAYAAGGRTFRLELLAGGYRLMTLPEMAPALAAFHKARSSSKLTRAGVETLAIIAYRQPVTRAELEAIRGVACGEVLKTLMERRLVTITGRAEELGRPMLYGTTRQFLELFGLASVKDLPSPEELRAVVGLRADAATETGAPAGEGAPVAAEGAAPAADQSAVQTETRADTPPQPAPAEETP